MDNNTKIEYEIYTVAKASLGKHMTLDPNVPAYVGCAEAVSAVLELAGISDGPKGIASTALLDQWLESSNLFEQIANPEAGAIIVSPTVGVQHGHTGIVGAAGAKGNGITGIMSNNSDSGLFLELWDITAWKKYYVDVLGLKMNFYRALDKSC